MRGDEMNLADDLPAEIKAAVTTYGLDKVAANLLNADTLTEGNIYTNIGASLFLRRKEAALIRRGLTSLHTLAEGR